MSETKKKILIIEDDPFLVKAYHLRLKQEDMDVEIATTGTDAILLLEKEPPSIILLDLMLPGVSGFDILSTLRKIPAWRHVPVIIVSNLGQVGDINLAKSLGADDYIVKGNTRIDDVVDVIKTRLNMLS